MHATDAEIKSAYKKLAMKYHPDRNQGSKFHEEHFKKIVEAYQVLSDKDQRNLYDIRNFYDAVKDTVRPGGATNHGAASRAYGDAGKYARNYAGRPKYSPPTDPFATRPKATEEVKDPVWYKRAHLLVVLFWSLACVGMLAYWIYSGVSHSRAVAAFESGNYELALSYDEYYGEAYEALAYQYMGQEEYLKAASLLVQAEKYLPTFTWQHLAKRAFCYEMHDDIDLAIMDLESARSMNPANDSLSLRLGELFVYSIKKPIKAVPYLMQVRRKPKVSQEYKYRTFLAMGIGHFIDGNNVSAIQELDTAATYPQASADVFYYRGQALYRNGSLDKACNDWWHAKQMGQSSAAVVYDELHCAYVQQQTGNLKP